MWPLVSIMRATPKSAILTYRGAEKLPESAHNHHGSISDVSSLSPRPCELTAVLAAAATNAANVKTVLQPAARAASMMHRPTSIACSYRAVFIQQEVCCFEVSVDDLALMQVVHATRYLHTHLQHLRQHTRHSTHAQ